MMGTTKEIGIVRSMLQWCHQGVNYKKIRRVEEVLWNPLVFLFFFFFKFSAVMLLRFITVRCDETSTSPFSSLFPSNIAGKHASCFTLINIIYGEKLLYSVLIENFESTCITSGVWSLFCILRVSYLQRALWKRHTCSYAGIHMYIFPVISTSGPLKLNSRNFVLL